METGGLLAKLVERVQLPLLRLHLFDNLLLLRKLLRQVVYLGRFQLSRQPHLHLSFLLVQLL